MRDQQLVTLASLLRSCSRRLLAPFACLLLVLPLNANADALSGIVQLAQKGATELALQQLDSQQPNPLSDAEGWLRWERQRIALYQQAKQWQSLITRINEKKGFIDLAYQEWFIAQQAEAMLALGQGRQARAIYRQLIWKRDTALDAQTLEMWRSHIVRSYLLDNKANDAHAAMLRNGQDYPSDNSESAVLLRARVLLLADRADDAAELLRHSKTTNAKTLYLLAALRSARMPATKIVKKINKQLKKKKLVKQNRLRLLAIKAEASKVEADKVQTAVATENYLRLSRKEQLDDGLFHVTGDQLWQAYRAYAQLVGNKQQLLLGDDASWFAEAAKRPKQTLRQRSIYALLALESRLAVTRDKANELLINSLQKKDGGIEVIRHLYLNSKEQLPALASYNLLEQALKESDIKLASQLMQGLQQAPSGVNPLLWELRRARVFVMAGKPDDATIVLNEMVAKQDFTEKNFLDRFMQVVFDLQTIEAHEQAYLLFESLLAKVELPKITRELYYWMAESRKAQKRYADAAALYLKSSESKILPQPDLWAQSAMYQAAQALADAGLVDDAGRLYKKLLRITKDEARRGQLQRRLQQLWLKRGKTPA